MRGSREKRLEADSGPRARTRVFVTWGFEEVSGMSMVSPGRFVVGESRSGMNGLVAIRVQLCHPQSLFKSVEALNALSIRDGLARHIDSVRDGTRPNDATD